jgi:hypothetical protein
MVSFFLRKDASGKACMLKYKYRRNFLAIKEKELIREYFWINNERLVYNGQRR